MAMENCAVGWIMNMQTPLTCLTDSLTSHTGHVIAWNFTGETPICQEASSKSFLQIGLLTGQF